MISGDLFYAWARLVISFVHLVCWLWVLRLSVPLARRAEYADQRIFVVAVCFVLTVVSTILALSVFYNPFRPPNPDGVLAAVGIALPTVLTIAGIVIVWKWPWRRKGAP
jgi:hypothetical protein